MICPRCQNQLPEGSVACNRCGTSFVQQEQNVQKQAAQDELTKLKKKQEFEGFFFGAGVALVAFFTFLFIHKYFIAFISFAAMALFIFCAVKVKMREKELAKLAHGNTQVSVCPKCKSPNIQMQMVHAGSVTHQGKTTVSKNINPLKPFTYANINQGNNYTTEQYKNKCHCLNCGNIFDKPEITYI